jgi:hypothetical protein
MQINNLFSEQTSHWQKIVAWVVYFFINIVFCIKYNPVDGIHPIVFLIFYPLIVIVFYRIAVYLRILHKEYFFLTITIAILLIALFLWFYIDRWSVQVDRWSALAFWSENLKNGNFPYGTPTHLGGYASPFPVWQLFHFPFHLLGDTAYGQLFCLLVFFVSLYHWRTKINTGGFMILLALSPAFWWEIAVRSDLLCNMLLLFVFLLAQFYNSGFWKKHKIFTASMVGLFLCTKLLVAFPLFLYFFPGFLKFNIKDKIVFALTTIVWFIIPFLPFLFGEQGLLNHPEYNPFFQQTRQGNVWFIATGCVFMVSASCVWKRMKDLYFLSGLSLFALILTVGIRIGLKNGWSTLIVEDELDKSYFTVCIPFFLYVIHAFSTPCEENRRA